MAKLLILFLTVGTLQFAAGAELNNFICTILPETGSTHSGTITFVQKTLGEPGADITVTLANAGVSENLAIAIFESGDITTGCADAGLRHWNPTHSDHGKKDTMERHMGDMGNFVADASGDVVSTYSDSGMMLEGPDSINGRACVVIVGTDDEGVNETECSETDGCAGATRVACGVVGHANPV